jgi:hypothetical protein
MWRKTWKNSTPGRGFVRSADGSRWELDTSGDLVEVPSLQRNETQRKAAQTQEQLDRWARVRRKRFRPKEAMVMGDGETLIERDRYGRARQRPGPWLEDDMEFEERKKRGVPGYSAIVERILNNPPSSVGIRPEDEIYPEYRVQLSAMTKEERLAHDSMAENAAVDRYAREHWMDEAMWADRAMEKWDWHKKNWTKWQDAHAKWMKEQGFDNFDDGAEEYGTVAERFRQWRWQKREQEREVEDARYFREHHEELGQQLGEKLYPEWESSGFKPDRSQNWDHNLAAYNQWQLERERESQRQAYVKRRQELWDAGYSERDYSDYDFLKDETDD